MATDMSSFIRISIPCALVSKSEGVRNAVQALTVYAGGVTRTEGLGVWFDDRGKAHEERVLVFQWNFAERDANQVNRASRELVDQLFAHGEKAVLKERRYTPDAAYRIGGLRSTIGYAARMLYSDHPKHEQPEVLAAPLDSMSPKFGEPCTLMN